MELVRYNINTNLNNLQEKAIQENNDSTEDTVSAVFATGFSLIASQLGDALYSWIRSLIPAPEWLKNATNSFQTLFHTIVEGAVVFALFVIFFFLSFLLFRAIWKKLKNILYANKSASFERSLSEYKKIVDDFDHIACDAILFSQHFVSAYKNEKSKQTSLNKPSKTVSSEQVSENKANADTTAEQTPIEETARFYLYEAIYYLKKAEIITSDVFLHGKHCINSPNTVDRISIHRLENMILLMEAILIDLKDIVKNNQTQMESISSSSLRKDFDTVSQLTKDLRSKLNDLLISYSK